MSMLHCDVKKALFFFFLLLWVSVKKSFKKTIGTSLVAQWLRLCAPNAGDSGSIPGQGTRSHTLEPMCHNRQLTIPHATPEDHMCCSQDPSSHINKHFNKQTKMTYVSTVQNSSSQLLKLIKA